MLLEFYSKEQNFLGNKSTLQDEIAERTTIPLTVLEGTRLSSFSVEERLGWAENRQTKRVEDEAYSLLGIFSLYMPLIYGEGRKSAMKRLKKSIEESGEEAERDKQCGGRSCFDANINDITRDEHEEAIQTLRALLRFKQIDTRQLSIEDAYSKTCTWILEKPEYLDWLDEAKLEEHHGILWIKGHPGSGKSTIMKYILNHTVSKFKPPETNYDMATKGPVISAFFFNARGDTLEKSTLGMYRSLVVQFLDSRPSLGPKLLTLIDAHDEPCEWNLAELQKTFEVAVLSIRDGVTCFVDALDECKEKEVRNMLRYFDHIRYLAMSQGVKFRVCLASRHYPHISIRTGIELVLENQEGHVQESTNTSSLNYALGMETSPGTFGAGFKKRLQASLYGLYLSSGF
ncbi:hypothetical protein N0V83_001019 [Neocucurbitaria cava]|uniref:Nephrocystin 3-like N-terminal domain-containing protein n=1 Tax=Neocucurbitaria cava TaxID=798079 RepID=A0A9W9CRM7_9PLEO|nr:hypothetical protein N0V83_001019 [Neocucurbitaria cava]